MANLPDKPVSLTPATEKIAVGRPRPQLTVEDMKAKADEQSDKAKYKIEVMFSRHRSTSALKPSPIMLLIWESGKRLHGGGDEKMYWCGYQGCGKPIPSSDFAYMHVVCRHCRREMFLDPDAKAAHMRSLRREGRSSSGIDKLPIVVGEKLANLTPQKLADLLVKTWSDLDGEADIYIKYSPYEIRWDPKHETVQDLKRLDKVRMKRQPVIYTLRAIRKDLSTGTDLRVRFLAMITA